MERFLNAFNMSAQPAKDRPRNNRGVVRALVECSALCKTSAQVERAAPGAAELLMGREDIDFSGADDGFFQAGNFQVVVLDNGRVSASLESLLGSYDPDCQVYNRGRDLFTAVLERNDRAVAALAENADGDVCLLSGSPLEASFVWALSTRAALRGSLKFGEKVCVFQCTKLYPTGGGGWTEEMRRPPSRLFPGKNSSDYDLSSVMDDANANAFFHVEEGAGLESHPLADAWFRAEIDSTDSLVLLDFAGGGFNSVSDKVENARSWIAAEREKVWTEYNLDLHVVILAPFASGYRQQAAPTKNVEVVLGEDARLLLGGLGQVSRWFV